MAPHRLGIVREHLSPDLIFSAFHFTQMAADLEAISDPQDQILLLKHRSYVMAAVLSAVAFLESVINELFYVVCDKVLESTRLTRDYKEKLAPIWSVEKFRKGARILEKYQTALLLIGKEQFIEGEEPYQSAKLTVDLRNALVHYEPKTRDVLLDQSNDQLDGLEKKLRGKFKTNPFSGNFPVVSSNQPDKRAKYPFFPERCLSHGCSYWASKSCLSFANDFFKRINVNWHYQEIINKLPGIKIEDR